MGSDRVLICCVAGRRCALPLAAVIETMRPLPTEPVVGAADAVLGVAVIRGIPTAVLDLAQLLRGTGQLPGRFVTIRVAGRVVALAVEDVVGVAAIESDSLPPLLGDGITSVVESIAAADRELVFVLQAARLVDDRLPA